MWENQSSAQGNQALAGRINQMTISATHINKKTGMEVCAWVNSHKASNGETSITYRKVKNGQMTGPLITVLESKFLANYGEA